MGRSNTAFTTLKIAVLAPIPSTSASSAMPVNPGLFQSIRLANRISFQKLSMGGVRCKWFANVSYCKAASYGRGLFANGTDVGESGQEDDMGARLARVQTTTKVPVNEVIELGA